MGWPVAQLRDIALDVRQGFAMQPCGEGDGIPQVRTNNVTADGRIDLSAMKRVKASSRQVATYALQPGDVVFNNTNSPALVGKTAVFAEDKPYVFSNHMTRIRVDTRRADPRYVAKFLHRTWATGGFEHLTTQWVSQAAIGRDNLERLEIPFPPLDEQRRIADLLDEADRLRRLRAEADATTQRILPALFIKVFGDPAINPHGWSTATLGDLLEQIDGGWSPVCLDRAAEGDEWGVLKLGAVTWGRYDETQHKGLPAGVDPRTYLEVKSGDVLFVRKNTRDLVGACAFVHSTRQHVMLSDLIFRLVLAPDAPVLPEYLWGVLMSPNKRQEIKTLAGGSAGSMPNISKQRLRGASISVPPLELQLSFAKAFQAECALRAEAHLAATSLAQLLAAMSERAFLGTQLQAASHSH